MSYVPVIDENEYFADLQAKVSEIIGKISPYVEAQKVHDELGRFSEIFQYNSLNVSTCDFPSFVLAAKQLFDAVDNIKDHVVVMHETKPNKDLTPRGEMLIDAATALESLVAIYADEMAKSCSCKPTDNRKEFGVDINMIDILKDNLRSYMTTINAYAENMKDWEKLQQGR